ncbi:hypothetical protein Q7P35_005258 [Cladosporium inversicolor]
MHDRRPPSLQGNSRRAGNDVLHLLPRALLTPICGPGIGQPGLDVLTQTAASCLTCGLSSYQARQEMPPSTSFSMASLRACNKVWLAECNELQIRRLYLRVVAWPYHGHHGVAADGSRPQRSGFQYRHSTTRDISEDRAAAHPFPPRCVKGRSSGHRFMSTPSRRVLVRFDEDI